MSLKYDTPTQSDQDTQQIQEWIRDTHLSSLATPETITTQMGTHHNGFRSAWFERIAQDPGHTDPAILTLNFPPVDARGNYETSEQDARKARKKAEEDLEKAGADKRAPQYREMLEGAERDIGFRLAAGRYETELNSILDALGLTMLVWTKGTTFTVYAARKTEGAYGEPSPLYAGEKKTPYLPQNIRRATREQRSHSGMVFNPEIRKQGNPPKRMRLLSLAQGAWSAPMPSRFPFLEIPAPPGEARIAGDGTLRIEERDTQGRATAAG